MSFTSLKICLNIGSLHTSGIPFQKCAFNGKVSLHRYLETMGLTNTFLLENKEYYCYKTIQDSKKTGQHYNLNLYAEVRCLQPFLDTKKKNHTHKFLDTEQRSYTGNMHSFISHSTFQHSPRHKHLSPSRAMLHQHTQTPQEHPDTQASPSKARG